MRRYPSAGVGHMIKVSVKRGTPETRRQMYSAVVIRQRRPFRRIDGTWVQFADNACVITNERGEVQGTDIKGPVSRESAERWPRIAATAKQIV
ncbi:MAG: uL14 family ribosomal protein, partial [Candidatus Poseidoniaceae archaeon]|nr:uL14 family ribosomal protein [Candidatus Poseidoniaceae archaeon]